MTQVVPFINKQLCAACCWACWVKSFEQLWRYSFIATELTCQHSLGQTTVLMRLGSGVPSFSPHLQFSHKNLVLWCFQLRFIGLGCSAAGHWLWTLMMLISCLDSFYINHSYQSHGCSLCLAMFLQALQGGKACSLRRCQVQLHPLFAFYL